MLLIVGVVLVVVGWAILSTWEIEFFRNTSQDAAGLTCGSPLDNPGWDTGTPCHGAVNRQTAVGLNVFAMGSAVLIATAVVRLRPQRRST